MKKKLTLEEVKAEGFEEVNDSFGYYVVYAKNNERVFYNPIKKEIVSRFNLDNLMKGTI